MQYKKELDIKGYGKMTSLVKGLLKGKMEAFNVTHINKGIYFNIWNSRNKNWGDRRIDQKNQ